MVKRGAAIFALVALMLIGAVAVFWFMSADDEQPQAAPPEQERAGLPQAADAQQKILLSTGTQTAITDDESVPATPDIIDLEVEADTVSEPENPYIDREVKARLAQVADQYAQQIQYPSFSVPIPDREALQKYLPNRSFAAERPLNIEQEMSPRIRLWTDKQQYFDGDIIHLTVSLSGLNGHPRVAVEARLVALGQTLSTANVDAVDQQAATYRLSFSDLGTVADLATEEYRVVASVTVDGQTYELGTPVSYLSSVAKVTGVGMARVSGEYLYIPVDVTTTKPGYHELTANLYAAESGRPLVHLSDQQELQATNGLMELKAHIAALKVGGDPGPYLLQEISFRRMPSAPDYTSEYGESSRDSYPVNGYAFDEYDDLPYVDETARQRLEFLRQAGQVD